MLELFKKKLPHDLTGIISFLSSFLAFLIAFFYILSGLTETLHYQIMGVGVLLLLPYLITRTRHQNFGKLLLCLLLPALVLLLSIYNKAASMALDIINPVNYFDTRLIMISSLLVPMTIFKLSERKLLILGLLPSALLITLYDPIHIYFGVDYYMAGLTSSDYYFSANLFSIITYVFLTSAFLFLKSKLEKSEHLQKIRNDKLQHYMSQLIGFGQSEAVLKGNASEAYRAVVARIQEAIGVSRVSIWEFDKTLSSIRCKALVEAGHHQICDLALHEKNHPAYFQAIISDKIVIADEAKKHAATKAFERDYLKPLQIYSMVDVTFMNEGHLAGIICCEHQKEIKRWTLEDTIYLKSMADMISLMNANRKHIIRNEELEQHVKARTLELREKNKQLQEYAYINAHILRAPVARVYGLYHLIESQHRNSLTSEILSHFKVSVEELDDITRKINVAIEELGTFNRDVIR